MIETGLENSLNVQNLFASPLACLKSSLHTISNIFLNAIHTVDSLTPTKPLSTIRALSNGCKATFFLLKKTNSVLDDFLLRLSCGFKTGKGEYTWKDGTRYEGEFLNGLFHGQGKYIFTNGDRYEGELLNGLFHGQGKYIFANGDRYEGEFVKGWRHGQGKYIFANGDRYEGEFVNGLFHGQGKYTLANGDCCLGSFVNNCWNSSKKDLGSIIFLNLLLGINGRAMQTSFSLGIISDYLKSKNRNYQNIILELEQAFSDCLNCPRLNLT